MADTKAQHITATLNRVQKEGSQWCVNQTMWGEKYWIISVVRHWLKPGSNWIKLPFICSGLNNRLGGRKKNKKLKVCSTVLRYHLSSPLYKSTICAPRHTCSLSQQMHGDPTKHRSQKSTRHTKAPQAAPGLKEQKGGEKIFCSLPRWAGLVRPLSLDTRQVKERLKLENSIYLIISQNN